MLLTTCWIPSVFVILIGYGDLTLPTDLLALKPNSWTGFAVNSTTYQVLPTRSTKKILQVKTANDGIPELKILLAADSKRKIPSGW